MKFKFISTLLALTLLSSCAPAAPKAEPVEFTTFQGELNTARQATPPWTEGEKALLGIAAPDTSLLTDDEITSLVTPVDEGISVLPEESAADVDLLFRALKSAYGAYDYLGGDGVFLPIKEAILAELIGKAPLTGSSIGRVLAQHLAPVVKDSHFTVDGQALLTQRQSLYFVADLYFTAGETSLPAYEKPTIGPDGAIVWCFAALSSDGGGLPATATVGGREVALTWTAAEKFVPGSQPAYERVEVEGVPTLVCRTLAADADGEGVKALAAAGESWRGTPLMIADLRSNGGGNAMYAMEWFRGYADSDPAVKTIYLQNCSRLFSSAVRAYVDGGKFSDQVAANAGTWETARNEGGQVTNEGTVFVLQDSATASAGESFVTYLSSLENTVRVGSNTMGCSLAENIMDLCLPKSGVRVRFGSSLNLCGTTKNTEGVGIPPDLWVPPGQAEEAVARLIRYYRVR